MNGKATKSTKSAIIRDAPYASGDSSKRSLKKSKNRKNFTITEAGAREGLKMVQNRSATARKTQKTGLKTSKM